VKRVQYSRRAASDIKDIALHTMATWGKDQASRYIDELETLVADTIANNPELGRPCDEIRPGLRRMECGSHVIIYRLTKATIVVSRILHKRMLPEKNIAEGD
jgi:toxin ParE1/3/4